MAEYKELNEFVDVPRGTGVDGFLRAIGEILKLPRVHKVVIDARGKVSYTRHVRPDEPNMPLGIEFDTLMPYSVIRNHKLSEIDLVSKNAALAIAQLFNTASQDHLFPIAFIGSPNSLLPTWYKNSTGLSLLGEEVYGLPFYTDRMVEDHMLFLAAGFSRQAALVDTQKSYKILMPTLPGEVL